jgi:hypothetical protein
LGDVQERPKARIRPIWTRYRILAAITVTLSLVFGVGVLSAGPALASTTSSSSLASTAGHTCKSVNTGTASDGSQWQVVFCVELGIYTSAATGQSSVVAQVEAICQETSPESEQFACGEVNGDAAPFTPNIGGGSTVADSFSCFYLGSPLCSAPRTYFTMATTSTFANDFLAISPGGCIDNAWAVVFSGSWLDGQAGPLGTLGSNLGTPHYNVCMSSSGSVTWTKLA